MVRSLLANIAGYPGVFFLCAFSGMGIPTPEDLPLLYTGYLISTGELNWLPALCTVWVALCFRDSLAYTIGRVAGASLLAAPSAQRWLPMAALREAQSRIAANPGRAVGFGRVAPGVRVPTFFAAGASGMPYVTFMAYDAAGLAVLAPLELYLGFRFGTPLLDTVIELTQHSRAGWVLLAGLALLWLAWRTYRRRAGDPGP